ncbi:hypothetical protein AB0F92_41385 [Kitasatospora aureofaciens]|uniref:hypothetical protein n=1 Tax=Kitasatospora aureofaciens TaxID=1894 RepID=UPI0033D2C57D
MTSPTNGMSASEIIAALREKLDGRATTIVRYPDTVEHVRRLSDEIAGLPADDGSNGVGKGGKTGPGDHRAITEALDRLMSETGPLGRDPEVLERVRRLDRAVTAAADAVPSTEELSGHFDSDHPLYGLRPCHDLPRSTEKTRYALAGAAKARVRLIRFWALRPVWFEEVIETPNRQRNEILRAIRADAVS